MEGSDSFTCGGIHEQPGSDDLSTSRKNFLQVLLGDTFWKSADIKICALDWLTTGASDWDLQKSAKGIPQIR